MFNLNDSSSKTKSVSFYANFSSTFFFFFFFFFFSQAFFFYVNNNRDFSMQYCIVIDTI